MKVRVYESLHYLGEMSLKDWKASGLSLRNKKFLSIRKSDGTNKNELVRPIELKDGNLRMTFRITPTYKGKKAPNGKVQTSDFLNYSEVGSPYTADEYTVIIQLRGIENELKDWHDLSESEKKSKVFDILDTWDDVQFYSSDPSFLTQGAWMRADLHDSSIYSFPPLTDKNIWGARHDNGGYYLTKHIAGILEQLKFLAQEVVTDLNEIIPHHKKKAEPKKPEKTEPEAKKKEEPKKEPEKKKEEPKKPEPKKKEEPKKTEKKGVEIPKKKQGDKQKVVVKKK